MPNAFYRIQDKEARRFVGKCLETASKRLPAEELLLDPFLASDEGGLLPIPCPNPISNRTVLVESPPSVSDPTRSTDMTITGTLDPEEDTIFIKVQISDKDGMSKPSPLYVHTKFNVDRDSLQLFVRTVA